MRMRLSTDLERASWRALKSPAEPGMATEMKRNFPRYDCHFFWLTRDVEARSEKISARATFR